jgi:hypothetical protein
MVPVVSISQALPNATPFGTFDAFQPVSVDALREWCAAVSIQMVAPLISTGEGSLNWKVQLH